MSYGLVVDDHPLVARGVTAFLRAHPGLSDAVDAGDAEQARAIWAERGMPAIVLIDFWLSNDTAQAVIAHLLVTFHGARVLVMSGDDRPGVRATAMHTGAHGFVLKHESPEVFHRAVTELLDGGTWFQDLWLDTVPMEATERDVLVTPADLGLTERQGDILALLLDGLPNKRIAQALSLSESTVKEHVSAVLARIFAPGYRAARAATTTWAMASAWPWSRKRRRCWAWATACARGWAAARASGCACGPPRRRPHAPWPGRRRQARRVMGSPHPLAGAAWWSTTSRRCWRRGARCCKAGASRRAAC